MYTAEDLNIRDARVRFRMTPEWREFCQNIKELRGNRCELFLVKTKKLQVHHLEPENYKNLDETKFSVLSPDAHKLVEKWSKLINAKGFKPQANFIKWMDLIGHHLSEPARTKAREVYRSEMTKQTERTV